MLTSEDLIKLAQTPIPAPKVEEDPRSTTRKVVDTLTNGAQAAGGALVAGIAGINSLDKKGPIKTI